MQLPPLGLGALLLYWRKGLVDRWAGAACALGIFVGAYFGSRLAIVVSSRELQGLFGVFLIAAAASLWREPSKKGLASSEFDRLDQHVAQGTSLVALVPPTGLLAFLNYQRAGEVDWKVGLLIMPGIFLGGLAGSRLALRFPPREMRRIFAVLLLPICAWQLISALLRR
jgi:uncharacterized membrane protein YfcA